MKTKPWIIRSLNASNCNSAATDCVKEMLSALICLTDEMNNYFGFGREGFTIASGDVNLNILKRRYEEALKVIEATKEGQ